MLLIHRGFDPTTEQRPGDHLSGSSTHQHLAGQKDLNLDGSSKRYRGWIASLKVTCEMLSTVAGTQNQLTDLGTWGMRDWVAEGLCIPCPVSRSITEDFPVSTLSFTL